MTYYKFAIYATQVGGTEWEYISSVDSIHGQGLPNVADALYKGVSIRGYKWIRPI